MMVSVSIRPNPTVPTIICGNNCGYDGGDVMERLSALRIKANSWARHPEKDGRADHFKHAAGTSYDRAGHWVHHDRFQSFVADLKAFL